MDHAGCFLTSYAQAALSPIHRLHTLPEVSRGYTIYAQTIKGNVNVVPLKCYNQ